jgi:hypothetical protein
MATATTASTNLSAAPSKEVQEELMMMHRLQAQFGDLDLTQLVGSPNEGEDTADSDDESSVAEPTPEELQAWQAAQFEKGQAALEAKRHAERKSAVQRRRAELRSKNHKDDDEDDWEQVAALPHLKGQSSVFFPSSDAQGNELLGVHPLLQQMAEGDSEILGTTWKRLYSSAEGDGLSFYHLLETLKGYPGPTVLLVGALPSVSKSATASTSSTGAKGKTTPTTVGFYTTSPWTESTTFTGTSDCFLFAMDTSTTHQEEEKVHFFRPREDLNKKKTMKQQDETHYMYCHPSTLNVTSRQQRHRSNMHTDGLVHGLGVGGTSLQPRLHLTETLEDCRAMDYCTLFEGGDLLLGQGKDSLNYFDVDCLEVWAVGGEEWIADSLKEQQAQRDIVESVTMKARRIKDKKQFLGDVQLLSNNNNTGLFGHVQHTMNRCDM